MAQEEQKVSVDVIANFVNKSARHVQKLASAGIIPKLAHGKYPFLRSIKAYIDYQDAEIVKAKKNPEGYEDDEILDKDQEQARSAREDWKRKQRENAVQEGLLLDAEDVRVTQSKYMQEIAVFLETLADDISRKARLSPDQEDALISAIDAKRNDLHRDLSQIDAESE